MTRLPRLNRLAIAFLLSLCCAVSVASASTKELQIIMGNDANKNGVPDRIDNALQPIRSQLSRQLVSAIEDQYRIATRAGASLLATGRASPKDISRYADLSSCIVDSAPEVVRRAVINLGSVFASGSPEAFNAFWRLQSAVDSFSRNFSNSLPCEAVGLPLTGWDLGK